MAGSHEYELEGLRFYLLQPKLEIISSGEIIELRRKHSRFLQCLVERPRQIVTYAELLRLAWDIHVDNTDLVNESQKHTIHSTKNELVRLLKIKGFEIDFIESIKNKGYRLNADVFPSGDPSTENSGKKKLIVDEITPEDAINRKEVRVPLLRNSTAIIFILSFLYGALFIAGALLEIAYQLDQLHATSILLVLLIGLVESGTAVFDLHIIRRRIIGNGRGSFLIAIVFLVAAAGVAFWLSSYFIPYQPITRLIDQINIQAQPASAAFFKDVFLYFLPLGILYVLSPVYFLSSLVRELKNDPSNLLLLKTGNLLAIGLAIFWILVLIYSVISTFQLSDSLAPGEYHSLFVIFLFARFLLWFGTSLTSLVWFYWNLLSIQHAAQSMKTAA